MCTAYTLNSKLGNVTKVFFGIRFQIVPLKLSFAFWVLPCRHFSDSVSLKIYIGLILQIMYFRRPDPGCLGVYKMALPALYLHQLSEPMGQCG